MDAYDTYLCLPCPRQSFFRLDNQVILKIIHAKSKTYMPDDKELRIETVLAQNVRIYQKEKRYTVDSKQSFHL